MTAHRLPYDLAFLDGHVRRDPGDGGTLQADMSLVTYEIKMTNANDETRVLATPKRAGIRLTLYLTEGYGRCTVSTAGSEKIRRDLNEEDSLILEEVGDFVDLVTVRVNDTIHWQVAEEKNLYANDYRRDQAITSPRDGQVVQNKTSGPQVYHKTVSPRTTTASKWMGVGPSRPVYEGKHIAPFNNLDNWTVPLGHGKKVVDNTYTKTGTHSIKVEANGTAAIQLDRVPNAPLNLKGQALNFRWYFHDLDAVDEIYVYLYTDASNYARFEIRHQEPISGWNNRLIPVDDPSEDHADWTVTGTFDPTTIRKVRLEVTSSTGGHDTTFDHLAVNDADHPGIVILTHDDGDDILYDTFRTHLDNNGFRVTAFVLTDDFGQSGRMTVAEMTELQDDGHDIAVHGLDQYHGAGQSYTDISESEAEAMMLQCRNTLIENGYTVGANFLSWMFSESNQAVRNIAKKHFLAARTGVGNDNFPVMAPEFDRHFHLPGWGVDSMSQAEKQTLIDQYVNWKGLVVFYYHSSTNGNDFQEDMEYLKERVDEGRLMVMTLSEYHDFVTRKYAGNWYTDQSKTVETHVTRPMERTRPALWLDSEWGVSVDGSDGVEKWESRDGYRYAFEQGTAGDRPVRTAGGEFDHTAIDFEASETDHLDLDGKVILDGTAGTVFAVFKSEAATSTDAILSQGDKDVNNKYTLLGISSTDMYAQFLNAGSPADDNATGDENSMDTNTHIAVYSSDGAAYTFELDNGAQSLTAGSVDNGSWFGDNTGQDRVRIGGRASSGAGLDWDGHIYEIIAYDGVISSDLKTEILEYLGAKYAIDV